MKDRKYSVLELFYNLLNKDIKDLNVIVLSLFCCVFLFMAAFFSYKITNSYALFSNVVMGAEVIELKVPATDISITRAKLKSSENGGTELLKSSYTKNETSMSVSLPNNDSSVTYEVRITAPEDKSYDLNEIIVEEYTDTNISYKIEGISLGDEIPAGTSKIFTVTFYYETELLQNKSTKLKLKYEFIHYDCPEEDNLVCDLSGNGNHGINVGSLWDKDNRVVLFDGIDDYMYLDNLNFNNSTAFTVDFVAQIYDQNITDPIILFETSLDSNNNYGSFYIDTNEFGSKEITLAMKYRDSDNDRINHKMMNNVIDNDKFKHYTVTFNSLNEYDKFTRMYVDSVFIDPETTQPKEGQSLREYDSDISGEKLLNYPFYIASRAGERFFCNMSLKEIRVYNKELTSDEVLSNHQGKIVRDNLLLYYDFR